MWTRKQLKTNGKQLFLRNYWSYVAVALLAGIFTSTGNGAGFNFEWQHRNDTGISVTGYGNTVQSAVSNVTFSVILLMIVLLIGIGMIALVAFVGNVLIVGANAFYIKNRTEKAPVRTMLEPFQSGHYLHVVGTMFLMQLYIFLWSLLFIIPGVIKSYEYMMIPYILAENPGMDRKEAFAISKRMMDGQKWAAFVLELSFLGWLLLGVLTCGLLGIFWTQPYMNATMTELYMYNKVKAYNEGYIR